MMGTMSHRRRRRPRAGRRRLSSPNRSPRLVQEFRPSPSPSHRQGSRVSRLPSQRKVFMATWCRLPWHRLAAGQSRRSGTAASVTPSCSRHGQPHTPPQRLTNRQWLGLPLARPQVDRPQTSPHSVGLPRVGRRRVLRWTTNHRLPPGGRPWTSPRRGFRRRCRLLTVHPPTFRRLRLRRPISRPSTPRRPTSRPSMLHRPTSRPSMPHHRARRHRAHQMTSRRSCRRPWLPRTRCRACRRRRYRPTLSAQRTRRLTHLKMRMPLTLRQLQRRRRRRRQRTTTHHRLQCHQSPLLLRKTTTVRRRSCADLRRDRTWG